MIPWWEHTLLYIGAFIVALIWIIKSIDYDNLIKWRGIIRKEGNWQVWTLVLFIALIGCAAYCLYWSIIHFKKS